VEALNNRTGTLLRNSALFASVFAFNLLAQEPPSLNIQRSGEQVEIRWRTPDKAPADRLPSSFQLQMSASSASIFPLVFGNRFSLKWAEHKSGVWSKIAVIPSSAV